jgi:nucleotide-binding universal stress UspA family protein
LELYHKILIATDGSEYTKAATTHGLWLAKMSGAEVTAVFVVDDAVFMNQT